MKSLVAIMAVGRENKHHNSIFVETVHKTVLIGDALLHEIGYSVGDKLVVCHDAIVLF